jgi:hypothetical protein
MTQSAPQTSQWLAAITPDQVAADRAATVDDGSELKVSALRRLTLTEPVRLWLWSVTVVIAVGLVLAGWLTAEWSSYLTGAAAVVLGLLPVTEFVRGAVYSPAGVIAAARAAAHAVTR